MNDVDLDTLTASVLAVANAPTPADRKFWVKHAAGQITRMGLTAAAATVIPTRTVPPVVLKAAPQRDGGLSARDTDRLALCCHEAGHAVAGVLRGGSLAYAVVGRERCTLPDVNGETTFAELADWHKGAVAFAGPWAQAHFQAGGRPTLDNVYAALAQGGGRHCDRNVLHASGAIVSDHHFGMANLLERCWPAVAALAGKLMRDSEIQHKHVCEALGVSYGPQTGFEIENLRAGLRGVPGLSP